MACRLRGVSVYVSDRPDIRSGIECATDVTATAAGVPFVIDCQAALDGTKYVMLTLGGGSNTGQVRMGLAEIEILSLGECPGLTGPMQCSAVGAIALAPSADRR